MPVGAGQGTTGGRRGAPRSAVGWFWRMFGVVVVALRYPILLAWIAAASRAITTAALALAAGFGMLALVPLAQFREIATAMVLGILIDAFIVRSVLVPALVTLFGGAGQWPGRHYRPATQPRRQAVPLQPAARSQEPPAA